MKLYKMEDFYRKKRVRTRRLYWAKSWLVIARLLPFGGVAGGPPGRLPN